MENTILRKINVIYSYHFSLRSKKMNHQIHFVFIRNERFVLILVSPCIRSSVTVLYAVIHSQVLFLPVVLFLYIA